jgi:hypothetical protein
MKQQLLEARLAQIEAIARKALTDGNHVTAIIDILKVVRKDA